MDRRTLLTVLGASSASGFIMPGLLAPAHAQTLSTTTVGTYLAPFQKAQSAIANGQGQQLTSNTVSTMKGYGLNISAELQKGAQPLAEYYANPALAKRLAVQARKRRNAQTSDGTFQTFAPQPFTPSSALQASIQQVAADAIALQEQGPVEIPIPQAAMAKLGRASLTTKAKITMSPKTVTAGAASTITIPAGINDPGVLEVSMSLPSSTPGELTSVATSDGSLKYDYNAPASVSDTTQVMIDFNMTIVASGASDTVPVEGPWITPTGWDVHLGVGACGVGIYLSPEIVSSADIGTTIASAVGGFVALAAGGPVGVVISIILEYIAVEWGIVTIEQDVFGDQGAVFVAPWTDLICPPTVVPLPGSVWNTVCVEQIA